MPFCHWLFSSSRQPTRLFFFFIGHRRRCRPDRPPSQKDIKYCLSGPSVSVSLFRFLVLFLAACAAASRSTASVVCLCAVRWPRQHTQWVAEAKKKKKKKGGLVIYDDLPPETAISNQTNGRIVCYYCARSHTRRAQHGTAHTTHIPKKSRPSIFNRMACFSSTLPPQLFRGFLSLSVWLDFHPQLGSKTFPSYALIVKMKTGPG